MELYPEDLDKLSRALEAFEHFVNDVPGLFEVEVRIRIDDTLDSVIIGFGESGDPCILRFEKDPAPVVALKPAPIPYTINATPPLKDYDQRF